MNRVNEILEEMNGNKPQMFVHGTIVTMDSEKNIFTDGFFEVANGKIINIGENPSRYDDREVIDLSGKIVLPGLINTHAHSGSALFRGYGDDKFLMDWLNNYMWPFEKHQNPENAYAASALTHLEFLQNGITTNADMWYFPESIAEAARESGLRTVICTTIFSNGSPESDDTLKIANDFIEKYSDQEMNPRIIPAFGPHAIYTCSLETLKEVSHLAKKRNTLVHTHISETMDEQNECYARLAMSPTQALESVGLLENRVLAAHCIYLTKTDLEIFRQRKVSISYNPVSNLKLCSGVMPLKDAMGHGINISIGTDGPQSNNSLDLLRDLKIGSLIQKNALADPEFFPAVQAVEMATINGAKALGLDDKIGSLEIGKQADFICLSLERANLYPFITDYPDSVYSQIVYSASGANISDVYVDGTCLLLDGEIKKVDPGRIVGQAQKYAREYLMKRGMIAS